MDIHIKVHINIYVRNKISSRLTKKSTPILENKYCHKYYCSVGLLQAHTSRSHVHNVLMVTNRKVADSGFN